MDNVEAVLHIIQKAESDKETRDLLSQIDDFDAYLERMQIEVSKKRIMLYREDTAPQIVNFNC